MNKYLKGSLIFISWILLIAITALISGKIYEFFLGSPDGLLISDPALLVFMTGIMASYIFITTIFIFILCNFLGTMESCDKTENYRMRARWIVIHDVPVRRTGWCGAAHPCAAESPTTESARQKIGRAYRRPAHIPFAGEILHTCLHELTETHEDRGDDIGFSVRAGVPQGAVRGGDERGAAEHGAPDA